MKQDKYNALLKRQINEEIEDILEEVKRRKTFMKRYNQIDEVKRWNEIRNRLNIVKKEIKKQR